MSDLPKLVRNNIPEIIAASNKGCKYRIASREEMKFLLFDKLREESEEFLKEPSVEEAADIYEVFLAVLNHWDINFYDVVNHSYYKRDEKGSFSNNVILESVE